jgi:uncharacterized Ntn-hydrolase superfamily protein
MTFSIAARCARTGQLGVATSSRALAAGGLVPYLRSGVGAVASQSFVNPYLGIDGLELLRQGLSAQDTLSRLVDADPGRDLRQAAVVDTNGSVAAYTGERCIPWAGHLLGDAFVCLGNILVDESVVHAMADAYRAAPQEELSERLLLALEAGQAAGGDRRGRQSAGVVVFGEEEYPLCDLRVDDHEDPIPELRRVYEVYKAEEAPFLRMMPRRSDFVPHWDEVLRDREEVMTALEREEHNTIAEQPAAKES